MTDGGKSKFFGFLKGLLGKPDSHRPPARETAAVTPAKESPSAAAAPAVPTYRGNDGNGSPTPSRTGAAISVPLHAIISGLPADMRAKVKRDEVGDLVVSVPLDKILSQLAHGAVKVPFGEIRQAAPHIFQSGSNGDHTPVNLPLNEILSQLNPTLLVRRNSQKQLVVPDEILSPFDAQGRGLVFSVGNAKPVAPAAPRQAAPAPALPARGAISSVPIPLPPSASAPIPMRKSSAPLSAEAPITPISTIIPASSFPAPSPATAAPATDAGSLSVALKTLAASWPDAVRQEIVQLNLLEARLVLPREAIETALKRGRAVFPWRTVRSWIRPSPLPTVSARDAVEVELPLKIIAPLFLAARNGSATSTRRKLAVDETIPNLFFGFPRPDAAPHETTAIAQTETAPPSKPADTNFYVWNETNETARVDESEFKRKATGTAFVARYATPNEIVSRAAALDGVAGALIALPDGLMVANRIPPELNSDTLAAFLPQIFAKVSQCTKELRMGDLNNLNFTVGNVPWKIFRVNAIFFAAFGRAAEPLPTAQLSALAAELDRKPK